MKRLAILCLTMMSNVCLLASPVSVQTFMPDNDLWKEDNIREDSNVDQATFEKIIAIGKALYEEKAKANNEKLNIKANWTDSTVNASCGRFFGSVTINMYGGLARRPEITPDGFALVLCHELGHAYGGEPYIQAWQKMAAEGQADFYGAKECLQKVVEQLDKHEPTFQTTAYMESQCVEKAKANGSSEVVYEKCIRGLAGGQSLGHLLSVLKKEAIPSYETPDPKIAEKTLTSYPETIQCRLDSYFAGTMDKKRPACWFKDPGTSDGGGTDDGGDAGDGNPSWPFPFPFPWPKA